jgi:uncharacterized pyridoxamine 5'-phosphate oxidase family protein
VNEERIMSLREVWEHFHFLNRIILATVEGDQPRLRPVTLIQLDKRLMVTTGTQSNKTRQILENPKVEFLLLIPNDEGNTGYIRGKCIASSVEERSIREILFEKVSHVSQLWESPDDENLTVIEFVPIEYDYMKPGDFFSTLIPA